MITAVQQPSDINEDLTQAELAVQELDLRRRITISKKFHPTSLSNHTLATDKTQAGPDGRQNASMLNA